ncbi:MAG: hypothetical protein OEY34_07595 [Cyclobacteriaceae bacterium]|nr:hypothetical protein [Cyclobacteriaceae bacterium]
MNDLLSKIAVFGGFKNCSVRLEDDSRPDGHLPLCTTINSRTYSEKIRSEVAERISLLWNLHSGQSNDEIKSLLAVKKRNIGRIFLDFITEYRSINKDCHVEMKLARSSFFSGVSAGSQLKPNSKLISKAPEMYEALKYFVDRVEEGSIRSKKTYKMYKDILNEIDTM